MERASGVLLPVFSLPGGYSVGSVGEEARHFVDLLASGGFSVWQVLPVCLPGAGNSPYKSYSAFSFNYLFIDLPSLARDGLITEEELAGAHETTPYLCEYDRLWRERFALLSRAAARLPDRTPVTDFLGAHPAVADFCRFMALREANGKCPFSEFRTDRYDEKVFFAWAFTQYTFFRQWQDLRSYAAARGVRIMGDLPIYVDGESADVWASPDLFELDETGRPAAVAGVPPDYFSEDGQMWGNPLYRWDKMKEDGFAWWRARMAHTLDCFDSVRIDHFRGFADYYAIPASAKTAKEGKWRVGPGRPLIDALQDVAAGRPIIAEDLGADSPAVRDLLAYSGFPGMRVIQFAFLSDAQNEHLPHNYGRNTVAYTGTHDNNTLLGYLFEATPAERRRIYDYCGYHGNDVNEGIAAVFHALLASHADLVVFPVQDLLRYGRDTRVNRPGVPEGNWEVRLTRAQLDGIDFAAFRKQNDLFGRTPAVREKE